MIRLQTSYIIIKKNNLCLGKVQIKAELHLQTTLIQML